MHMTTRGGNQQDIEPLLVDDPIEYDEWSRHNDTELSYTKTVLNLDNRYVRLTLWCLVYIVLTTTQVANNMYEYIFYDNVNDDWWWTANAVDDEKEYYSLGISTNSILSLAVCIFLCSLYCACCKVNCTYCTAGLFIVGSVMSFATMIHGTQKECKDGGPFDNLGVGYCDSLFVGSAIFLASFSLYLAVDIVKSIGDNIRVRLFVKSLLISLRSFLLFAYWNKELNVLPEVWDKNENPAFYNSWSFAFRTSSSGNLICGIICTIIVLIIAIGYGSNNKKIHPFVPRLLSYFLLGGIGSTMAIGYLFGHAYPQMSAYYVVAGVLLVYDLHYL